MNTSHGHLELLNVGKRFGHTQVLNGIHAELKPGNITAFVGPNGAGKTTLFGAICGEIGKIQGQVKLDGKDITNLPPEKIAKRGIGRMFQETRIYRSLTARDNIASSLLSASSLTVLSSLIHTRTPVTSARVRAEKSLDEVGLRNYRDCIAGDLSWGNQKLLAFSRLIAAEFNVMLLDEPTSGISFSTGIKLMELIRKRAKTKGATIGIIEHDMSFVSEFADHMIVIDEGRVLQQGKPEEILNDSHFAERLLGL